MRSASTLLLVLSFLVPSGVFAQSSGWSLRVGVAQSSPGGFFQATRGNGKVVTSDIEQAPTVHVAFERQVQPGIIARVGVLGLTQHEFVIEQDFPDGTEFESRDAFTSRALLAGVSLRLGSVRGIGFAVDPSLMVTRFDDVVMASSGPPYDRTTPLDVDIKTQLGANVMARVIVPIGKGLSLEPWLGQSLVRFTGDFPADPLWPDTDGDIDVAFSPFMAGIAVGMRL